MWPGQASNCGSIKGPSEVPSVMVPFYLWFKLYFSLFETLYFSFFIVFTNSMLKRSFVLIRQKNHNDMLMSQLA